MTIKPEYLAQEYITLVNNYHPTAGELLDYCYVKILECYLERMEKRFYYIGVYYPDAISTEIKKQQDDLREVAENMGLIAVVCINATRLVRDPVAKLKEENPRLWLELHWVATHNR
jgi:hypothetical protein